MFIVVDGNPVDGYNHTGPFSDAIEANEWASIILGDLVYWVVELIEARD